MKPEKTISEYKINSVVGKRDGKDYVAIFDNITKDIIEYRLNFIEQAIIENQSTEFLEDLLIRVLQELDRRED